MLEGCTPVPEEFAERYRKEGYWRDETFAELTRRWVAADPQKTAVVGGGRRLTYEELDDVADRLAVRLLELGIEAPQRVVVQLPNVPEFVVLCLALLRIGVLPVLALPAHREHEIRHFCELTEAAAYFCPEELGGYDYRSLAGDLLTSVPSLRHVVLSGGAVADRPFLDLDALLAEPVDPAARDALLDIELDPTDVALFLVSGGTTGLPKLIPRTHNDYTCSMRSTVAVTELQQSEVYLASLPAAHAMPHANPGILGTLHVGGTVVLSLTPRPEEVLPLVQAEGVTATALVPALLIRWLEAPDRDTYDFSSLRLLQVGGQRLQPVVARRAMDTFGCKLQEAFGMAEGLGCFTRLDDPEELIVETQGRPMTEADELLVVDESGRPVDPGEPGELLTRGPCTIRGYYKAPEHNARVFTDDGFYCTGDVVRVHPSGNLIVDGRVKDMINRGGENISAEEVENLLAAHPSVAYVAVVAMPDRTLGERVCAYVVAHDGEQPPTLEDLHRFLGDRVAKYKWPERLEVLDRMPLTGVNKIDKKKLREDVASKLAAEASA